MTPLESLQRLYVAFLSAYGADPATPTIRAMESALSTGDEAIASATLAYVDRTAPKEAKAMAAVASELSADMRPPSLWAVIDVESVARPVSGSLLQALESGHGIVSSWRFRRENPLHANGRPLAARILCPGGLPFEHIEAAAQSLRRSNAHLTIMQARDESRRAQLAAALDRAPVAVAKPAEEPKKVEVPKAEDAKKPEPPKGPERVAEAEPKAQRAQHVETGAAKKAG